MCMNQEHGCQHSCISTPVSFYCECSPGYRLNVDGKTCSRKKTFLYPNSCRGPVVPGLRRKTKYSRGPSEASSSLDALLTGHAASWVCNRCG